MTRLRFGGRLAVQALCFGGLLAACRRAPPAERGESEASVVASAHPFESAPSDRAALERASSTGPAEPSSRAVASAEPAAPAAPAASMIHGTPNRASPDVPVVAGSALTAPSLAGTSLALSRELTDLQQGTGPTERREVAEIVLGAAHVTGGLLPGIDHALARLKSGIAACYARALGDAPAATSRVSLQIAVASGGSVKHAMPLRPEGLSPGALDCIVRRAQMSTFPAPVGGPAEVLVPVSLYPPTTTEAAEKADDKPARQ